MDKESLNRKIKQNKKRWTKYPHSAFNKSDYSYKYDWLILSSFFLNSKFIEINKLRYIDKWPNVKKYLLDRYNDSESLNETLWRMRSHIDVRPVCKVCGGKVKRQRRDIFSEYCSCKCRSHSKEVIDKTKKTNLEKYGVDNAAKSSIIQEKIKNTCLEKYGVSNVLKDKNIKERIKKTNLEKYSSEYIGGSEEIQNKIEETNLEKYGVECTLSLKNVREKIKKTNLEKYGVENYGASENYKLNSLKKYGAIYPIQSKEIQQKIKQNLIEKYGVDSVIKVPKIAKKRKETLIKKYGVDSPLKSPEILNKVLNTKKKNHTFNTSKPEDTCYKLFCDLFGQNDVIRQYKCDLYPWHCDFYIKSKNLLIEYQGYYTHGNHPFNANNINDIKQLNALKVKYKPYYDKNGKWPQIITIWTEKDVEKRQTAKKNKLNYLEFYSLDEVEEWIKLQMKK